MGSTQQRRPISPPSIRTSPRPIPDKGVPPVLEIDQADFLATLFAYGSRIEVDDFAKPENDLNPNPALLAFMVRLLQDQVTALEARLAVFEANQNG